MRACVSADLDTAVVASVAEFINEMASQDDVQVVIVSHRPEMYESAKQLVGVYN